MRFVCGKNGRNKNRIEVNYGVHVYISAATTGNKPQTIIVKGLEAGKVLAAEEDILEILGAVILDLDESFVEKIIGPGGETVTRLEMGYDVAIYFSTEETVCKWHERGLHFG